MAISTLNKLFVRISDSTGLNLATLSSGNPSKIYFVQDTNEIWNNGIPYGINPDTKEAIENLQEVLGSSTGLPVDASTVLERLTALEAISVGVTGATDADDYIVLSDEDASAAVQPKVTLKLVDIASGSEGLVDASNAKAYIDLKAAAATTTVEAGNKGISVDASVNTDDSVTYKVANELQLRYVAPAGGNSAYIQLYGVDDTSFGQVDVSDILENGFLQSAAYDKDSGYITLTFATATGGTQDVSINVREMLDINDMSIADDSSKYLTVTLDGTEAEDGGSQAVFGALIQDVSTASALATGLADAWNVKQYVDSKSTELSVSASGDTSYIDASVDASDNKHINVAAIVNDLSATAGTAGTYDADGAETAAPTHGSLSGVEGLVDGADAATKVKTYVDGEVAIEAARADAAILAAVHALDASVTSDDDSNVIVNVVEVDGVLTDVVVTTDYAVTSVTDSSTVWSVAAGDEGKLLKASDVAGLYEVVDTRFANLDSSIEALIESLDSSVTGADSSNWISYTVTEEDGVLTNASINVVYGDFGSAATTRTNPGVSDGIATVEDVINFVDAYDYWETYTAPEP